MKKTLSTLLFATIAITSFAQVGINTNTPNATLDVNGSFATRETLITLSGTSTTLDLKSAFYKITGGSGNFTIGFSTTGIYNNTIQNGQRIVIYNDTNFSGTYNTFTIQSKTAQEFIYSGGSWYSVKAPSTTPSTLKWFYAPSIALDTTVSATAKTINVYDNYVTQFTKNSGLATANYGFVSSNASVTTIPYYTNNTDFDYFVTGYDKTVFSEVTINSTGLLSYKVIAPATDKTFLNIVLVPKN